LGLGLALSHFFFAFLLAQGHTNKGLWQVQGIDSPLA
jgi:hypothetical protein